MTKGLHGQGRERGGERKGLGVLIEATGGYRDKADGDCPQGGATATNMLRSECVLRAYVCVYNV